MEKKCAVEFCSATPVFACLCDSSAVCAEHLGTHQVLPKVHNYIPLAKPADNESKKLIIGSLIGHLSYMSLLRKKVCNESNILVQEILRFTLEFTKKIAVLEESLQSSIKVINGTQESTSVIHDFLHSLSKLKPIVVENEIKEWSYPIITPATRKVLKELESLYKLEFVKLPYSLPETKYLYFFADDSMMLNSFNTEKNTIQAFRLPLKQNRGNSASICFLPQSKMFYGGGQLKNKAIATYMLIDEFSGELQLVPGGRAKKQSGCCYYQGKVWLFGGCEADRALKTCEKYDLGNKTWEDFAELPSGSDTSVCAFDSQIFVTGGQLPGLYQFFPEHNSYLNIFQGLDNKNKFLCCGHGKIFMFYEDQLYVSENWNTCKWRIVPLNAKLGKYWISTWVLFKGNVYFTTGHYSFFDNSWPKARKLDLSSWQVTDII